MAARHTSVEDRYVIRDRNRSLVFGAIITKGPISRSEIAEVTGLSHGTVTKAVAPMVEAGYVTDEAPDEPRDAAESVKGRPRVPLRVRPERRCVVGVKTTGHEVIGVVANLAGTVVVSKRVRLVSAEVADVVRAIGHLVKQLVGSEAGLRECTHDLGVVLGGHVDADRRLVHTSLELGWREVPLARLLTAETGLRTVVENNVNALAVAEQWFGAGVDVPWFVVVTLGAGVGSALVLDGQLMGGVRGGAGELGHAVVEPGGRICRCGNRGCLETVAADPAILASIVEAGGPDLDDIRAAADLARSGDLAATAAFTRAGTALGTQIATLANIVNPQRIILSGEGVVSSDLLMTSLREAFAAHVLLPADHYELLTHPLPDEAWARGAAMVALQDIFVGSA
ncbi:ROK family protein [Streptomyces sp. NPDC090032]|uniref:ROK family protein n=1 Tax=unclassified Streptomyces TaxID=2593676 RepID=UPI0037187E90